MTQRRRTDRRPHETVVRSEPATTHLEESSDDFLDMIRGRFSETDQHTMRRLDAVKAEYVASGKDRRVTEAITMFLRHVLSRKTGERQEGGALIFSGESGVGKSSSIARALSRLPQVAPVQTSFGEVRPFVSIRLQGPTTLKLVGKRILDQAGYPFRRNIDQGDLWDMLPEQLHHRRIFLVHIDEVQHIIRETAKEKARKDLADAIKDVMNYEPWPISFILSGMPIAAKLARDEQIERRCSLVELPPLRAPHELPLVGKVLRQLCRAGELDCEDIDTPAMLERIAHAANYRFGRVCQVVVDAIHVAVSEEAACLDRDHFAEAFRNACHAYEIDEKNPFLADDFRSLPPGLYFPDKEKSR
ncbi:ATP-binding protein [Aurantimonas coralicida]|uniref:ATP-binding protein n=2 Tax=Aurantimonas coralicida TaxID=182270 RepID=UPI0004045E0C|nr:ATP-binding protein [Aurantimonas coralicida]